MSFARPSPSWSGEMVPAGSVTERLEAAQHRLTTALPPVEFIPLDPAGLVLEAILEAITEHLRECERLMALLRAPRPTEASMELRRIFQREIGDS